MSRRIVVALAVALLPAALHAHPVPKDNHDRTIVVHLTPTAVVVDYRLELDERRAVLDLRGEDLEGVDSPKKIPIAFRKHFAPILADNLVASLDGDELTFRCVEQRSVVTDHLRCEYRFVADWKLSPDKTHRFRFREANYPLDSSSRLAVRLSHSPRLTLKDAAVPSAELIDRPSDRRKPGDDERLRSARATVLAVPSYVEGVRPPMPPDSDACRPAPEGLSLHAASARPGVRATAGVVKPYPEGFRPPMPPDAAASRPADTSPYATSARPALTAAGQVKPDAPPPEPPPSEDEPAEESPAKESFWRVLWKTPKDLLDTDLALGLALAAAAAIGALHALSPGHGKTLVAAYLVGQHGTVLHAIVLGLVVTFTHTGSVLLCAVLFAATNLPERVAMVVLNLVGGLVIAGLGVWLLMKRLTGGPDHIHLGGGHDVPDLSRPGASWWTTVTLGMAGGIVPCWDAILLLLYALAMKRPWLGVVLLLAFSAGLAAVLISLGLLVVTGKSGAGALAGGGRFARLARLLPIASAVAIIAIGLWMTFSIVTGR
jgi:ABC-type nickel/cobalt efflux system permease component RcnA